MLQTTRGDLWPTYRALSTDALRERVAMAVEAIHDCALCGNQCHIDRTLTAGPCAIGDVAVVASYGPHFGEEQVLSGVSGSGTIFFSGCNLHCRYCQNYDISQQVVGSEVRADGLARIMLLLQEQGCHNINLVSPTHVAALLVPALALAAKGGLRIPIVYNTGGYDSDQALALMDGLVDIYMPDMKYADEACAQQLSLVRDYPTVNQAAVRAMHKQVGDLVIDSAGLARRGLLVRHLVLPGDLAGTDRVVNFLADEISANTYINVMGQYHPAYRAAQRATADLPINRRVTHQEIAAARASARAAGLHRFAR
jgi:putative pyruvate formate lyase activating enzyme